MLVDKPCGPTSHDVVAAVRTLLGARRVGHAGTLDPGASGLLVVLVGRATRLARFVTALPKRYAGTIRFGAETTTDDAHGAPTLQDDSWRQIGAEALRWALEEVAARTEQVPPAVSAKKVGGQRAYRLARRGDAAELAPARVAVYRLEARRVELPEVDVEVECSSGTYVRAIARDVGRALGSRAHLAALRRTGIGAFDVSAATPLGELTAASVPALLRPLADAVAHLPQLAVDAPAAERVRHGGRIEAEADPGGPVAVTAAGALLAVAEFRDGVYAPLVVLAS